MGLFKNNSKKLLRLQQIYYLLIHNNTMAIELLYFIFVFSSNEELHSIRGNYVLVQKLFGSTQLELARIGINIGLAKLKQLYILCFYKRI